VVMDDSICIESFLPWTRRSCSWCDLELRAVNRYLESLSYENVNDVQVRLRLTAARGFCHHHAWQFVEVARDNLGAALIYRDILGVLIEVLRPLASERDTKPVRNFLSRFPLWREPSLPSGARKLLPTDTCPACEVLSDALRDRGYNPDNLCLHHLRVALASAEGHRREALCQAWARKVERLLPQQTVTSVSGRFQRAAGLASPRQSTLLDLIEVAFGKRGVISSLPTLTSTGPNSQCTPVLPPIDELAALPLSTEECPLCALLGYRMQEELGSQAASLAERVEALVSADDLCSVHAWRALELNGDPEEARGQPLSAAQQGLIGKLRDASASVASCRACRAQREWELAYALQLGAYRAWETQQGWRSLCLPHLLLLLKTTPQAVGVLASSQISAWQRLRAELGEYLRKQDYRFRNEPRGPEETSPLRAIAAVAGARTIV